MSIDDLNRKAVAPMEPIELPKRALLEDLEWLARACAENHTVLAEEAVKLALAEWSYDLLRVDRLKEQFGLQDWQANDLIERLRRRNFEVWGEFSQAK